MNRAPTKFYAICMLKKVHFYTKCKQSAKGNKDRIYLRLCTVDFRKVSFQCIIHHHFGYTWIQLSQYNVELFTCKMKEWKTSMSNLILISSKFFLVAFHKLFIPYMKVNLLKIHITYGHPISWASASRSDAPIIKELHQFLEPILRTPWHMQVTPSRGKRLAICQAGKSHINRLIYISTRNG